MRTNKRRVAPNINSEMGACISKQQPLPIYTQIEETINLKDLYHSSRNIERSVSNIRCEISATQHELRRLNNVVANWGPICVQCETARVLFNRPYLRGSNDYIPMNTSQSRRRNTAVAEIHVSM